MDRVFDEDVAEMEEEAEVEEGRGGDVSADQDVKETISFSEDL